MEAFANSATTYGFSSKALFFPAVGPVPECSQFLRSSLNPPPSWRNTGEGNPARRRPRHASESVRPPSTRPRKAPPGARLQCPAHCRGRHRVLHTAHAERGDVMARRKPTRGNPKTSGPKVTAAVGVLLRRLSGCHHARGARLWPAVADSSVCFARTC